MLVLIVRLEVLRASSVLLGLDPVLWQVIVVALLRGGEVALALRLVEVSTCLVVSLHFI